MAALLLNLSSPSAIRAQTAVALGDPDPARWDVAGHASWLTVDKTGVAPDWNRWYDVAAFGGSIGRFFGPHVKVEFDGSASTTAQVYVQRQVTISTQPLPIFVSQAQRFRMGSASVGAFYQFFDNRWFHPFAGGGVEVGRETRIVEDVVYPLLPRAPAVIDPPGRTSTWRARPFADAGFKCFVTERTFLRSDVRTTLGSAGISQVAWRTGVGVDF